jgi:hypothetical protein
VGLALAENGDVELQRKIIKKNDVVCAIAQKMKVFRQLPKAGLFALVEKTLKFTLDHGKFVEQLRSLEQNGVIEKAGEKTYKYLLC